MKHNNDISNDNEFFIEMLSFFDLPVYVLMKKEKEKITMPKNYCHIFLENNKENAIIKEINKYKDCDEYVLQEKLFIEVVLDVIKNKISGIIFHNNEINSFKDIFVSYDNIMLYKDDIKIMECLWQFSNKKIDNFVFLNKIIDEKFYIPFDKQNKCIKTKDENKNVYIPLFLNNERLEKWNENFEYSESITIREIYKRFNLKNNKLNIAINPQSIISIAITNDAVNDVISDTAIEITEEMINDTINYFGNLDEVYVPVACETIDVKNNMGIVPCIPIQNKLCITLFEKYEQAKKYVNRNFIGEDNEIYNRICDVVPVGYVPQEKLKQTLIGWYDMGCTDIAINIGKANQMIIPIHKMFKIIYGEDITKQKESKTEDCIVSVRVEKNINFLTDNKKKFIKNQIKNKHYNFLADATTQEVAYAIHTFIAHNSAIGKDIMKNGNLYVIFLKLLLLLINKSENQSTNYVMWNNKKDNFNIYNNSILMFFTDEYNNIFYQNNIEYLKVLNIKDVLDEITHNNNIKRLSVLADFDNNFNVGIDFIHQLYGEYERMEKEKTMFHTYAVQHCGLSIKESDDLWSLMILEDRFSLEFTKLIQQYDICKDEKKPNCKNYFKYKGKDFDNYKEKYDIQENYQVYFKIAEDLYKR